jgi:hypothetical protein
MFAEEEGFIEIVKLLKKAKQGVNSKVREDLQIYENKRFGFRISFPNNWPKGEEPTNGDGIYLYQSKHVNILVYGRFHSKDFPPDLSKYRPITLDNGKQAYLTFVKNSTIVSFSMIMIKENRIEYHVSGEMPIKFYQDNSGVIDKVLKSFETFPGEDG